MRARVERAVAGDYVAVRELVDALTPSIQNAVVRALLRRRHAAGNRDVRQEVEDLTQSVFLALFKDGGRELLQWDPARRSALPTFVGLLAQREVASILRSQRRNPWTDQPTEPDDFDQGDEASGADDQTESRQMLELIAARMKERLSERGLELFYLLLVDDRSTEDACTVTGMTADAVHQWRSRLQKLARQIREEIMSESASKRRIPTAG